MCPKAINISSFIRSEAKYHLRFHPRRTHSMSEADVRSIESLAEFAIGVDLFE